MRVHDGTRCICARRKRGAAIEPKPADPEQTCAHHRQRRAMGQDGLGKGFAFAKQESDNERSNPCCRMHHNPAGKIERSQLGQPPAAPDPTSNRHINQQRPQCGERDDPAEADPLDECPDNQRGRDDGKCHLKKRENAF